MLNGFEYQVYLDVHQVTDEADGRYRILCEHLNGAGCEDIEAAWQEIIYKDLYAAMENYTKEVLPPLVQAFTNPKEPKVKAADITKLLKAAEKQALAFETECEKVEKASEGTFKEKTTKAAIIEKINFLFFAKIFIEFSKIIYFRLNSNT